MPISSIRKARYFELLNRKNKQKEMKGNIDANLTDFSKLFKEANAQQIEANTKQIEANTGLIDENRKSAAFRRWTAGLAIITAIAIYAMILCAAYIMVFYRYESDELKMLSISATVLSFVVIFSIIIRSALTPPQQNKTDNSNASANGALDIIKTIFGNQ